jgi:hypothetical protein
LLGLGSFFIKNPGIYFHWFPTSIENVVAFKVQEDEELEKAGVMD